MKKILIALMIITKTLSCPVNISLKERLVKTIILEGNRPAHLLEKIGLFIAEEHYLRFADKDLPFNESVLSPTEGEIILKKIDDETFQKRLELAKEKGVITEPELKKYTTNLTNFKKFLRNYSGPSLKLTSEEEEEAEARNKTLEDEKLAWSNLQMQKELQESKQKLAKMEVDKLILQEETNRSKIEKCQNKISEIITITEIAEWAKDIIAPYSDDSNPAENKSYSELEEENSELKKALEETKVNHKAERLTLYTFIDEAHEKYLNLNTQTNQTNFDVQTIITNTNTSSFELVDAGSQCGVDIKTIQEQLTETDTKINDLSNDLSLELGKSFWNPGDAESITSCTAKIGANKVDVVKQLINNALPFANYSATNKSDGYAKTQEEFNDAVEQINELIQNGSKHDFNKKNRAIILELKNLYEQEIHLEIKLRALVKNQPTSPANSTTTASFKALAETVISSSNSSSSK